MARHSRAPYCEQFIRAQMIRELIRDAHGAFAPDFVARALRFSYLEPKEEETGEIAELLADLADMARARLEENGIEPLYDEKKQPLKLHKRDRDGASNLTMLLATRSVVLAVAGDLDQARKAGLEGLAWARVSQNHETHALQWMAFYMINERLGQPELQEAAVRHARDEALASHLPALIADTTLPLASFLIEFKSVDEAEELVAEVQSLIETDLPEDRRNASYAITLMHTGRIARKRGRESLAIQSFREALRWADPERHACTRSSILSHLGWAYIHLEQYRQCIECQQEIRAIADRIGSNKIKSWANMTLAQAHTHLKEYDQALELLAQAEGLSATDALDARALIKTRLAATFLAAQRFDESAAICRQITANTEIRPRLSYLYAAYRTLGEIDEKSSRLESAEENYRQAMTIAEHVLPMHLSTAAVGLARILYSLERYDEAIAVLDNCSSEVELPPTQVAKVLRLRASVAEAKGELRAVIDFERQAVAIEQSLLEQQAEQSLRNARIVAETDLLEREAELERERRRRLERELATVVVALGDRKRQAAAVEEQLRTVLAKSTNNSERAVTTALREALLSLRTGSRPQETVHHYLAKVDEDFHQRLRERFPSLTRKQERLCGLIRAGLDSKEIASLLGLESEGLKALRKRLRKALDIDQKESLESFLTTI